MSCESGESGKEAGQQLQQVCSDEAVSQAAGRNDPAIRARFLRRLLPRQT